ncbi:MAG: hypothetical protein DMF99_24125 [Acidobacteria bacterium]|nr:MAG: hypothetical protein DMF99_24125 [Acidobacteriota bacterium]
MSSLRPILRGTSFAARIGARDLRSAFSIGGPFVRMPEFIASPDWIEIWYESCTSRRHRDRA